MRVYAISVHNPLGYPSERWLPAAGRLVEVAVSRGSESLH